jgi:prolyl 4-hydroxylase
MSTVGVAVVLFCFVILIYAILRIAAPSVEMFAFADGSTVCTNKFYFEMDNFLPADYCDYLMQEAGRSKMEDSQVGEQAYELDKNIRNSQQVWLKHDTNVVTRYIRDKVMALVTSSDLNGCMRGIQPETNFEDIQVVKYGVRGKYDPHFDGTECGEDIGVKCFENQRIATVLIYLNDEFEGGHTRFPNLGVSVTPVKGKAVFFWVSDRSNKHVYKETMHGGDPVTSGEKWIATQWIRA